MARLLDARASTIRCVLFGARSSYIDSLLSGKEAETIPGNLSFGGYVSHPEEALEQLDVVVNLSHCQESFGRTVLEAMAAGRAVVCYDWGALPELVISNKTGFLTPVGEPEIVAENISKLAQGVKILADMGVAGRERAVGVYGHQAFLQALERVFNVRAEGVIDKSSDS